MDPGACEPTHAVVNVIVEVLEGPAAGRRHRLEAFPAVLGRGGDCDVCLEDHPGQPTISRRHVEVLLEGGRIALRDLSTNGTWIGPRRLVHGQKVVLPGGELVHVGPRTTVAIRLDGVEELDRHMEERDRGLRGIRAPGRNPGIPGDLGASGDPGISGEHGSEESDSTTPSSEGLPLEIATLGRFTVTVGGRPIPQGAWRTRKTIGVLVYLAEQGGSVSFDRLEETLWADAPEGARSALHTAVSRIRRSFRELSSPIPLPDPIRFDRGSYRLDPAYQVLCDTTRFESLCDRARGERASGQEGAAADHLREAIALNHGPFLEGNVDHWAELRRHALQDRYCEALEMLGDMKEKAQRPDEAARLYEKSLERDPCRETSVAGLLRSLGACGLAAEAIRRYQAFARLLQESMALAPGPDVVKLYDSLRAGSL